MSILDVTNVSHGFGARQILENVSFRLLKGEHIGLVGANGEGKSTFLNIITGKLMPDEGKVEWCNHITTGYLDQYSTLEKGKTIRDILRSAFNHMFELEKEMIAIYDKMGDCTPEEMDILMEDVGEIQSILESGDFYSLDSKIEEYAAGLGLMDIGLEKDVTELDEPTNFLDENHITWLKNFLQNYENAFIFVSHDIPFLNSVTNVIYHMENAELTRYTGDYYQFQEMYELKKRQLEQAYKKQQKEIEHLKDFIAKIKLVLLQQILQKTVKENLTEWI